MPESVIRFMAKPPEAVEAELRFRAPPRLCAHHMIVHDVAARLLAKLKRVSAGQKLDEQAILLGAATHDIGKAIVTEELYLPGRRHEEIGPALLLDFGMTAAQARFARTHGCWRTESVNESDLVVALADTVWKGCRDTDLELRLAAELARQTGRNPWGMLSRLSPILESIERDAPRRIEFQRSLS